MRVPIDTDPDLVKTVAYLDRFVQLVEWRCWGENEGEPMPDAEIE